MYHLPGGAAQEKKEKGRTCARSFARNFPNLSETFPETSPPNLYSLSVCAAQARSGAECLWKGGEGGSVRRHDSRALSG